MSTFLVCAGLLVAVVVRGYVGVLINRELVQNPALLRQLGHGWVAST